VASLSKLIDDHGVDPAEGDRALAVFVHDSKRAQSSKDKQRYWERFLIRDAALRTGDPPATGGNDLRVGVGCSVAPASTIWTSGPTVAPTPTSPRPSSKDVNVDRATLTGVTYNPKTIWPAGFYAPPDRTVLE
jgi:hypothetical protein